MCAVNHFEAGAFIRSNKGIKFPDVQHHFFPGAVEQQKDVVQVHAYQVHCGTMRPKSRGYLKLKSKNPREKPIIQPNLLSVKQDLEDLKNAVRLTVEIMNAKSFEKNRKKVLNFNENKIMSDDNYLEDWLKTHLESAYHCSCTCAMGKVTDSEGRVIGLKNLRVVDASIMPAVTSGNTNAPTIMIAERIADLMKGESLSASKAKFYVAPEWETKQR